MKLSVIASLAVVIFAISTSAAQAKVRAGTQESLTFVAETNMPGLSLCHRVEHIAVQGIPLTSESRGYAIARDQCDTDTYTPLTSEQFAEAQAMGQVPADLPLKPRITLAQLALNILFFAGVPLGFIIVALHQAGFLRKQGRAVENSRLLGQGLAGMRGTKPVKLSKNAGLRLMAAMCAVAQADDHLSPEEISSMMVDIRRLTGNRVSVDQVLGMAAALKSDEADLREIMDGAKRGEAEIILEAALRVAASDSDISASEYAVIQELTTALHLGRDQVTISLQKVAGDLAVQPA